MGGLMWRRVMRLIEQVEGAGYRDRHGHPIENNVAYRALKEAMNSGTQGRPSMLGAAAKASSDGTEPGETA